MRKPRVKPKAARSGAAAPAAGPRRPNPAALQISEAAEIFSRCTGRAIGPDSVRGDVQAGAPTNPDGTINLVHYGAWLIRKSAGGAEGDGGD